MSKQLSLFDLAYESASEPLPIVIAHRWNFPLQYQDVDGERHYAVQDWIAGVALTHNPTRFWTDMKKRFLKDDCELYAPCVQLPYTAQNGKTYKMDFATAETLYLITQRMDASTGLRTVILSYLAVSGVAIDEIRRDPVRAIEIGLGLYKSHGKLPEGTVTRAKATEAYKTFRYTLKEAHETYSPNYRALFIAEIEAISGLPLCEIAQRLGLMPSETDKLRSHMGEFALKALELAELSVVYKLESLNLDFTDSEQRAIVIESANLVAPAFRGIADYLGQDLITGKPAFLAYKNAPLLSEALLNVK